MEKVCAEHVFPQCVQENRRMVPRALVEKVPCLMNQRVFAASLRLWNGQSGFGQNVGRLILGIREAGVGMISLLGNWMSFPRRYITHNWLSGVVLQAKKYNNIESTNYGILEP